MNVDLFDLERFVTAQDAHDVYHTALQEVKDGLKRSHWMWFVFPQIQGLGDMVLTLSLKQKPTWNMTR